MPFTESEKINIRSYLGYPETYFQNSIQLQSAMAHLDTRDESVEFVRSILTDLALIEEKITAELDSIGIKKADEVEFKDDCGSGLSAVHDGLMARGNILIGKLSTAFGVPCLRDYFSPNGYPGMAHAPFTQNFARWQVINGFSKRRF